MLEFVDHHHDESICSQTETSNLICWSVLFMCNTLTEVSDCNVGYYSFNVQVEQHNALLEENEQVS